MSDLFELFGWMIYLPFISLLEIASAVFIMLFMYYSAKHRNQTLSAGWYICGFLFGFWTLIVFLIKRKDFPGADTKKCPHCGCIYPETFEECQNCHIVLPQIDKDAKKKEHKLSKIFCAATIISYVIAFTFITISSVTLAKDIVGDVLDDLGTNRIAVNGVYYDKKGNSYEDENDVLLYDEDGHVYTYTGEEAEDDDFYSYVEYYYVREDGKKYAEYDCYVTEDGWFYCDKAGVLEYVEYDTTSMTEEELDEYYDSLMNDEEEEYKYYDSPYSDKEGNKYYWAIEASWNEKGELITAENDIGY